MRRIISRGGCLYARLILRLAVHDLTGGFKCFHRRVLEAIALDEVGAEGYAFQIEMTYRSTLLGFTVVEVPIIFSRPRARAARRCRAGSWPRPRGASRSSNGARCAAESRADR